MLNEASQVMGLPSRGSFAAACEGHARAAACEDGATAAQQGQVTSCWPITRPRGYRRAVSAMHANSQAAGLHCGSGLPEEKRCGSPPENVEKAKLRHVAERGRCCCSSCC